MNKKIMIVDDDEDMRRLLKRIFMERGFDVSEAESGEDCLRRISIEKPGLVLLDRCMPGMDGWEVLRRIKSDCRLRSIKVAMLTSFDPTAEEIMREEFDLLEDYILKPSFNLSFVEKIRRLG
jgi:CheY-like chemotaxis protein